MAQSRLNSYTLNFGPHHPSTHGVLRLFLEMDGEVVVSCNPEIGYLHRGVEKLVESRKFLSIIPFLDRLDYLSPLLQEHAFVLALERCIGISPPRRAVLIRTIFDELTRISSHIMALGSASYEIGALSLFLYGFEEREKIMEIFEETTGARMHLSYYVPGGVLGDINEDIISKINAFIDGLGFYFEAVEKLALNNRIFKKRTKGIGIITKDFAISSGISGVNLRASGVSYDVRKSNPYGAYESLQFDQIVLQDGDCYARNELRYLEIKQSVDIIRQCLQIIEPGEIMNYGCFLESVEQGGLRELVHAGMFAIGLELPKNTSVYSCVESPRGEFGIHMLTAKDQTKPYRMHFKSPSFAHIQMLKELVVGSRLADVTAILGSLDFLIGDCDR